MTFDQSALGKAMDAFNFGAGPEQMIKIYLEATGSVIVPKSQLLLWQAKMRLGERVIEASEEFDEKVALATTEYLSRGKAIQASQEAQ